MEDDLGGENPASSSGECLSRPSNKVPRISAHDHANTVFGDEETVIEQGCAQSEVRKRRLIEVFSVRISDNYWVLNGHLIYGYAVLHSSVSQYCDAVILGRKHRDPPIINKPGWVTLNGPASGVEVKDEVAIHAYLWTMLLGTFNYKYANTLWSAGVQETNKLLCKTVLSEFGSLEVAFAVYNDGVEAQVEVALADWRNSEGVKAFGDVKVGNSNIRGLQARSCLFAKSYGEAIQVTHMPGCDLMNLPLSRSVTVVPRGSTLLAHVNICRVEENGSRNQRPIFAELGFDAMSSAGTETKIACGDFGNVEVKVTWSG